MAFSVESYVSGFVGNVINAVVDRGETEVAVGQLRYPELFDALEAGEEVWVPCAFGYEKEYDVSSWGRVRSKHQRNKGNIRMNTTDTLGYQSVGLSMQGQQKSYMVHRLVRYSFYTNPNPEYLKTVEHDDDNPSNNRLNNLLFASTWYQNQRCNKRADYKSNGPKQSRAVEMLDLDDGHVIMTHDSMSHAMLWLREHGGWPSATVSHISECANGETETMYGRGWRFAEVIVDLPGEVWKPVSQSLLSSPRDGPYLASTEGRIQNKHGKRVHGCMQGEYLKVGNVAWNRVIAFTFCENDDPVQKVVVKHLNNNKIDNRACNLVWDTELENTRDAVKDGLVDRTNVSQKVKAVNSQTGEERIFARIKDTAPAFNVSTRTIWLRLNDGKALRKTHWRVERI